MKNLLFFLDRSVYFCCYKALNKYYLILTLIMLTQIINGKIFTPQGWTKAL